MALDVQKLGQRITQLRELKNLSLSAVAEAAQIAKSYLAKIERGEVENPGLKTLNAIARALDVTVSDLLSPVESSRGPTGEALVADAIQFERLTAEMPDSLRRFIERQKELGRPVPPDVIRALATVQFRGKRPKSEEDWQFLYLAVLRAVG